MIIEYPNKRSKKEENKDPDVIDSEREEIARKERERIKKEKLKKFYIILSIIIVIIIIIISVVLFLLKTNKKPKIQIPGTNQTDPLETDELITIPPTIQKRKIEKEEGFSFKTELEQLNRIEVVQQYNETTIRNGKLIQVFFNKKTIYDIFVISENEPIGELKYCYSKLYTCAISIVAECEENKNSNCVPETVLDLTGESIADETEIRNLETVEDVENIPIFLCLFNITDNNAITSIKCPKSIDEGKIKGIILDIYFFRPPGIKRVDKKSTNITINITDLDNGKKMVRETNGNICGESFFDSFCSTDMNTTKDSEGNLISYKEIATTNIKQDENNYYSKIKVTSLNDKTQKDNNSTAKLYKQNMEKLLEKINPYLHYYEQVSEEQFLEIYRLSVNGEKPKKKKIIKKGRYLENEKGSYIKEENIFEYSGLEGGNYFLSLVLDSSLNTPTMKANSYSKFNEDEIDELVNNNQESILTQLLNKLIILSKAGNHLANELYQNIKKIFGGITQEIQLKISALNNLMSYENITKIFDSTFNLENLEKLPLGIVEDSNILYEKINGLLTEIKTTNFKKNFTIINQNIQDFLSQSHNLINIMSRQFQELVDSMKSKGNQFTQISLYYLNQKSSSFMDLIQRIEEIFTNYYKDEAILIKSNITTIIENFEKYLSESSEKEKNMINELSQKLDNNIFYIENGDDNISRETSDNLKNIINILNNIKLQIEDNINKEINLYGNYFIPESEIKINNISYVGKIDSAKEIDEKLDKKLIDKEADKIMGFYRQNFTDDLISMGIEIENQFYLEEESLKENLFKNKETDITSKFKYFSKNAINEIKKEIGEYNNKINSTITNFLKQNEEELESLINDLYVIFSNESLIELAELYDEAFNSSLNTTDNLIKYNENLVKEYLDDMRKVIENTTYILELIHSYQNDEEHIPYHLNYWSKSHYDEIKKWNETITQKKITDAYISKYNTYKANIKSTEDYINNQLYLDLFSNYKNPIVKLRKTLQTIKNNKLNEKYPNFSEIGFNEHKKVIDILYNRLNAYLSDDLYNKKYISLKDKYISSKNINISKIKDYIDNQNGNITKNAITSQQFDSDYCVQFKRIKSYLCTNKIWHYSSYSDDYCLPLSTYKDNHNELKEISINSNEKLIYFNNKFNEFFSAINKTVEIYNSKINKLKYDLENIENEIMNKKVILNYIDDFQEEFNNISEKYYGEKIIRSCYDKYKNNTEKKIGKILNKSKDKWIKEFEMLETNLNNNKNNFTYSLYQFKTMAIIYYSVITQNISESYYNSIITHQKNEYNYTISYYYNYLLRLANSTHNYIINRIIKNNNNFNYLQEQRINLINEFFKSLMRNITLSEKNALNLEKQLNILGVEEKDFFKVNYILEDNIQSTVESLYNKYDDISMIDNDKNEDQYSFVANMYFENLESNKQITSLYNQIYNGNFISLNKDKFEDIVINNNWIFNFDEFNNEIEVKLYNLQKEIKEEFLNHKEDYYQKIENLLNEYLTKEGIIEKVNEIYNDGIKEITEDMKNNIINNINDIVNSIVEYLRNETKRIKNTADSFNNDTTLINNTIKDYKIEILNKLNDTIILVANDFNQNMENKFYLNYVDKVLNNFYNDLKVEGINNKEYQFLNSNISFQEIINKILNDIQKKYKYITKKHLLYKYNKKLKEIYNIINLTEIETLINNEIDSEYKKENGLLSTIYHKANNDAGYKEYNFKDEIKNEINDLISIKINNIEQIINLTKGNNYQINIYNWKNLIDIDFTEQLKKNVIDLTIKTDFEQFCSLESEYEKNSTNELLEEVVKANFNNTLNYLIPTFGQKFFERISKYNENFKIMRLYDNLRYSISETLAYYTMLSEGIGSIPVDLKKKIYNLNSLDLTIKNKNTEIINKINGTLDEFLNNIQKFIIDKYNSSYTNEMNTEDKYDKNLLPLIKSKLFSVETFIRKICRNTLEKYLKEPFIESYKKVINQKSNEMILFAEEQKETIRVIFKDITIISTDNILNIINENLNKTEESINNYLSYFKTFKIDKDFIQFLNNYGNINIHPLFLDLLNTINDAKSNDKNNTLKNFNENSTKYENLFDVNEFINLSDNIYLYFKNNFIKNLTEYINLYGPSNYKENLERYKQIYEKRYLRNLEGNETEEEVETRYRERISDKALDTTFNKILSSSDMVKTFINSLNEFEDFDERIKNFMILINENYKKSQKLIKEKKEKGILDEELFNIFNEKLDYLNNMTKDYYIQINENYNNLKFYLNKSLNEIDNSLNLCRNETYTAFNDEYIKIKNEMIPIAIENYSDNNEVNNVLNYSFSSGNTGQIKYNVDINSKNKAYFSLDLLFEDMNNYNPTVIAKIINLSGPKNMKINIIAGTSNCAERERILEVTFGSANYSMVITYNTQSTKINVTTITNYEHYSYNVKEYIFEKEQQSGEQQYLIVNGIKIPKNNVNKCFKRHIEEADDIVPVERKSRSHSVFIDDFI